MSNKILRSLLRGVARGIMSLSKIEPPASRGAAANHQQKPSILEKYRLQEWWNNDLDEKDRNRIRNVYSQLYAENIQGPIQHARSNQRLLSDFTAIASNLNKGDSLTTAYKVLQMLQGRTRGANTLDVHYFYHNAIALYYKSRERDEYLRLAIDTCQKMIALAPRAAQEFMDDMGTLPEHSGFKQLAIILDKQKDYAGAIALCEQADAQGWAGDWQKRADRYRNKLGKKP